MTGDDWDATAFAYGTDKAASRGNTPGHGYMHTYHALLNDMEVGRLLEIGVWHGGSLRMWAHLFPNAQIIGVDNDSRCRAYEGDRIHIHIADQGNPHHMQQVGEAFGPFDVIVDDGSHDPDHALTAYHALAPHCHGWYFIEDLPNTDAQRVLAQLPPHTVIYPSHYPDDQQRTLIATQHA